MGDVYSHVVLCVTTRGSGALQTTNRESVFLEFLEFLESLEFLEPESGPPLRQRRRHGAVGRMLFPPAHLRLFRDGRVYLLGRHHTPFAVGVQVIDPSVSRSRF